MENRFNLTWNLILADQLCPIFGAEHDVTIQVCLDRIKGIWESYGLSEEGNRPLVWAYVIQDKHGRTFDADRLVDGNWIPFEVHDDMTREFYMSMNLEGVIYP